MKQDRNAAGAGPDTPQKDEAHHRCKGVGFGNMQSSKSDKDTKHSWKAKAPDSRTAAITTSRIRSIGTEVITTPPEKVSALRALVAAIPGNTVKTQEERALEALARWTLSTFEASRYLDLYDPRARIMALRNQGHRITTTWVRTRTECGRIHRLGMYTLERGQVPPPILCPDKRPDTCAELGHAVSREVPA